MAHKGGGGDSLWFSLSALDAFPKVNEDFFKKTMSGGAWREHEQLAGAHACAFCLQQHARRGTPELCAPLLWPPLCAAAVVAEWLATCRCHHHRGVALDDAAVRV
jgi:hypothetical protein